MTAKKKNTVLIVVLVIAGVAVVMLGTCVVVVPMMLRKWAQTTIQNLQQPYPFTALQWKIEPATTVAMADSTIAEGFWKQLDGHLKGTSPDSQVSQIDTLVVPTGNILVTDMNFIE
ncbi:MAG: hypothetical protein H6818_20775, partial [Phycisphaerales bacterium]|nr:hypothetical protein [Phycisphaerales bacterium]